MNCFARWILVLLAICTAAAAARAQATPQYIAPSETGPHGSAPGMWVKVLNNGNGTRHHGVRGHLPRRRRSLRRPDAVRRAVPHPERAPHGHRGLSRCTAGLLRPRQKKMYRLIPIDTQVGGRLAGRRYRAARRQARRAHALRGLDAGRPRAGRPLPQRTRGAAARGLRHGRSSRAPQEA